MDMAKVSGAGSFLPLYRLCGLPAILFMCVPWNEDINLVRLPEALTYPQEQLGAIMFPCKLPRRLYQREFYDYSVVNLAPSLN